MAGSSKAPEPFDFAGDVATQWSTWQRLFNWYIRATRNDEEDEEAERIKQERVAAYAAKKSKSIKLFRLIIEKTWW